MILRPTYIEQIKPFINKPQIKIITGIRRSGKSTVLKLIKNELLSIGIDEAQIIHINFESFLFSDYTTAQQLYRFIASKTSNKQKYYLLLDEIQEVADWEKAINSF